MNTVSDTSVPEGDTILHQAETGDGPSQAQDPIFEFQEGLLGFPSCKRFSLTPAEVEGFYWLQSLECESLAFLTVDPFRAIEGFSVDLGEADLHHLQTNQAPDVGVMAIVTLPRNPGDPSTANFQGILAFNFKKRMGRQVIVHDSPYGTRWPLDLQRIQPAS